VTFFLPHESHGVLHRIWMFATLHDEVRLPEHVHIIDWEPSRYE
jgi:hypothetical protein